ncbi:hypothetical protein [Polaribacter sp. WD7]|uniref:hypothetical protein n=1 Tax=Polaribacter sp. WD7 TaxID=2269061 RepID=UPI0011BF79F1|nr:hypothetical protein [Polaribacter sp. WD7]
MNFIKIILTLFLIPLLACSAQQEETNKFIEITYSARTRGYQMTIIYKEDKLTVSSNISNKTISLTNKQQVKIQKEVSKIVLSEINNLKAPSDKRFIDGTLSASLKIKNNSGTYISSDFDHENPPKELRFLYLLLESIIKKG